ncbi:MAG: potassium channel family protein [Anaerolineae bacterium]|nr:potassium channel family protein [Anaerolineae bacterium]
MPLKQERNKNLFLLSSILIHNLIYPFSTGPGLQPALFYVVFSFEFVIAVYLLTKQRSSRIMITVFGIGTFISGVVNAYVPGTIALPALYLTATLYISTLIVVLIYYIFAAKRVLIEVVLAAASLYLASGFLYAPIFGFIELVEPGSFAVNSGAAVSWQQLFYFSYTTLTTLGYGDITPAKFYAQSFAIFEAVTGVLYTVIILSRLVSLYEAERVNRPTENDNPS